MNGIMRDRNGRALRRIRMRWRFLAAIGLVAFWLTGPGCEYEVFPGYHCDETNNCADFPTTVCREEYNLCVCPKPNHTFCEKFRSCVPIEECHPDAGPVCNCGGGGAGGTGGGSGGSGGGGAGGGG